MTPASGSKVQRAEKDLFGVEAVVFKRDSCRSGAALEHPVGDVVGRDGDLGWLFRCDVNDLAGHLAVLHGETREVRSGGNEADGLGCGEAADGRTGSGLAVVDDDGSAAIVAIYACKVELASVHCLERAVEGAGADGAGRSGLGVAGTDSAAETVNCLRGLYIEESGEAAAAYFVVSRYA